MVEIVVVGLMLLVVAAISVPLWRVSRARAVVRETSSAIAAVEALNGRYAASIVAVPPIRLRYEAQARSKSQFDKFDLDAFTQRCVLEDEASLSREIDGRWMRTRYHSDYSRELGSVRHRELGTSSDQRLSAERYRNTEAKLFEKCVLPYPAPQADVVSTVRYTSPKGQNSYAKTVRWNYSQLVAGFQSARDARRYRSTAEFQRSLMTPRLRTDILRRDGHRCRMCGASPGTGATLHVDHIIPVSRGGTTVPENLQTLCQTCNLGKSNRFVG